MFEVQLDRNGRLKMSESFTKRKIITHKPENTLWTLFNTQRNNERTKVCT